TVLQEPFGLSPPSIEPAPDDQRYRVLRWHDDGSLGDVFVAYDAELDREVALKRIKPDRAREPRSRSRFVSEARITGRLEHPGIVPIYGRGLDDRGRPYYAMRFIRGETLKDAIRRLHGDDAPGRDPGAWTIELRRLLVRFIAVCNAIAYAHS